jgi:hypothetical protein
MTVLHSMQVSMYCSSFPLLVKPMCLHVAIPDIATADIFSVHCTLGWPDWVFAYGQLNTIVTHQDAQSSQEHQDAIHLYAT